MKYDDIGGGGDLPPNVSHTSRPDERGPVRCAISPVLHPPPLVQGREEASGDRRTLR